MHSNLSHRKAAPLFTNCHKAVLSIAHHSRETQMALILGASLANWGIAGASAGPTCEFVRAARCPLQFFFRRCDENKTCKMDKQC